MATRANNHRKHYCRWCDYTLHETRENKSPAHLLWYIHASLQHPEYMPGARTIQEVMRCDKNCAAREQPDEQQHAVKLYGPGSARISEIVPPLKTAEEIFGPEED